MKLSDILGAGCIACGPESIEVLQQGFAETLATARAAGIIGNGDDLSSLAQAAHQHPETSNIWLDLHRLPARYSALAFLQWTARDLQRALERAPDWYVATGRGLEHLTHAQAMAFALLREKESGDSARGSRIGEMKRLAIGDAKKIKIRNAALPYVGKRTRAGTAALIAPLVGMSAARVQQALSEIFPKDEWTDPARPSKGRKK